MNGRVSYVTSVASSNEWTRGYLCTPIWTRPEWNEHTEGVLTRRVTRGVTRGP